MSTTVTILRWVVAVWLVLSALNGITTIGKPRKPVSPGLAIATIVMSLILAWLLVGVTA
jgi:hypothetical protein